MSKAQDEWIYERGEGRTKHRWNKDEAGFMALASNSRAKPIAFTLNTGYVVVGYPYRMESFCEASVNVEILPWASGFRDDHQDLELTTHYAWIYDESSDHEMLDFVKVIDKECIVSANLFDPDIYFRFSSSSSAPR